MAYPEPEAATDVVKVGDKINVYVVALGGENGLILSKTRADRLVAWEKVEKVKEEKQIIEVEILQVVKVVYSLLLLVFVDLFLLLRLHFILSKI